MARFGYGRIFWKCAVMAIVLFLMTSCSGSRFSKGSLFSSQTISSKGKSSVYHDFGDILVPKELKVDKKSSFIYHTPGFSGGVLALKGRVDMTSLITFFENNMARDNWRLISSFKSPRTIMLFHKESKWAVISISEREFSTYVEIWVAPTVNEIEKESSQEEGLLK